MKRNVSFFLAAAAVIVLVGVVVAQFASDQPDGLEYVATQEDFADSAQDHARDDAALADYGSNVGDSQAVGTAVAAIVGAVVVAAFAGGLLWLTKRSGGTHPDHPAGQR